MSAKYTNLELTALRVLAEAPAGRGWALHEVGERVAQARGMERHQLLTNQALARYAGQILFRKHMMRLWRQDHYADRLGGLYLSADGAEVLRAHAVEAANG